MIIQEFLEANPFSTDELSIRSREVHMADFSDEFPKTLGIMVCQIQPRLCFQGDLLVLEDPMRVFNSIKGTVEAFKDRATIYVFPECCFPRTCVEQFTHFLKNLDVANLIIAVGLEFTTLKEQKTIIQGSANRIKEELIQQFNKHGASSLYNSCLLYVKANHKVEYFVHLKTMPSVAEKKMFGTYLFRGRELPLFRSNKLNLVPLICYDLIARVDWRQNMDRIRVFRNTRRPTTVLDYILIPMMTPNLLTGKPKGDMPSSLLKGKPKDEMKEVILDYYFPHKDIPSVLSLFTNIVLANSALPTINGCDISENGVYGYSSIILVGNRTDLDQLIPEGVVIQRLNPEPDSVIPEDTSLGLDGKRKLNVLKAIISNIVSKLCGKRKLRNFKDILTKWCDACDLKRHENIVLAIQCPPNEERCLFVKIDNLQQETRDRECIIRLFKRENGNWKELPRGKRRWTSQ